MNARSERHAALEAAGQAELQRLQNGWPTDPAQLARWRQAPRTMHAPAEYAAALHGTRRPRGNGLIRSVILACVMGVAFALILFFNL